MYSALTVSILCREVYNVVSSDQSLWERTEFDVTIRHFLVSNRNPSKRCSQQTQSIRQLEKSRVVCDVLLLGIDSQKRLTDFGLTNRDNSQHKALLLWCDNII